MTVRTRILVLLSALVLLAAVAVASVLHASARADRRDQTQAGGPRVTSGRVTLTARGRMVFRNMAWGSHRDELTTVPASDPSGPRTASGVKCLRFHTASGTGVCLQAVHGAVSDTYRAVILDARLKVRASYDVPGIPSRARVSPSGHFAAWTAFVGGDSYAGTDFSTRAAIVDVRTGRLIPSLETFRIIKDGHAYRAPDINFWGVTFASDDRTFYATLATKPHASGGRARSRAARRDRARAETRPMSDRSVRPLRESGRRLMVGVRIDGQRHGTRPGAAHRHEAEPLSEPPERTAFRAWLVHCAGCSDCKFTADGCAKASRLHEAYRAAHAIA